MILLKVEIDNIKIHEHYTFEPAASGITSITGENGTGKSTIVDAFAWSLFGTRSKGLRNKNYIRDGVSPKDDPVQVQSYVLIGNKEYKIHRKIVNKDGNSTCDVYSRERDSKDEFELEAGPAITHAEAFIRKLIGTDERGFLASVFVQQKQVDEIISATPRDRARVVEQLIGLSTISEAIKVAKEESKSLQKATQIYQPVDLKGLEEELKEQDKKVLEITKEHRLLSSTALSLKGDLEAKEREYSEETKKQERQERFNNELSEIKTRLSSSESHLNKQIDIYKEAKKASKPGALMDVDSLSSEVRDVSGKLSDLVIEKMSLGRIQADLKNILDTPIPENLDEELLELQENLKKNKKNHSGLSDKIVVLKHDQKTHKDFIEILHEKGSTCPLCHSSIESPEELLKTHKRELSDFEEDERRFSDHVEKLETVIKSQEETLKLLEEHVKTRDQKTKAQEEFDNNKRILRDMESEITVLTAEKESKEAMLEKARSVQQAQALLSQTQSTIQGLKEEMDELMKEKADIEESLSGIGALSKSEYKRLGKERDKVKEDSYEVAKEFIRVKEQLTAAQDKLKDMQDNLEKAKEAHQKYKTMMDDLTTSNLALQALSGFKDDRTKYAVPALTHLASEILFKFTEGKFTEMFLNENFEASVMTKTGETRPVEQLSGGELSSVAIALRLAISIFLNGGESSLLILDEVLISMSEERSRLILETISTLTSSQMIFINHNAALNTIADRLVFLS